jgi:UDP-glucose 4-epimerase
MRAAVTGGAGFIGSNLVDALVARGDGVTVVDNFSSGKRVNLNPDVTLLEHDIRDPFELDVEVIFHLAAQADVQTSMQRPEYDAAVNVVGTVNVLTSAPAAQVIFASSYGIAKKCGEEYLEGWNRIHGTSHISLRFANVYGPRQDSGLEGGVVSIFLERLARGEPTTIFGDGGHSRDFVYVDDVVAALLAAVGRRGGPYNVGSGAETTVGDLHAAAARAVGVDVQPTYADARLGDVLRSALDSSRIERELGWRAQVPLEQGLERTLDWMRQEAPAA